MNLFAQTMDIEQLFFELFNAGTEKELDKVIQNHANIFDNPENWKPLGGNENNYGVIENQQSSPIAALIEKLTNSIDATLMKRCYESGIKAKSSNAPKNIQEAIDEFYPNHKSDWRLPTFRKQQAEEIQVIADGKPRDTSVIIYDNGEGQRPEQFEETFLSLLRGNKNEIKFVQGKYNMGGSGAIVFCGSKGYQLIASKRYNGTGDFGFTLIRQHPFTEEEQQNKKNTWYEYLVIKKRIPSFKIDELDLKLHNRKFKTGTIIKLYSYQFPTGYSGFAQDLNQSINEFLFEPALPIYTVDNKQRYPNNRVLQLDLYGLKRRLESSEDYIDDFFSEEYQDDLFGQMKVYCYVFKARVKDNDAAKTRENIRKRFFKNNMSVLFSMNGQVHGHYTSEFISRSLKMSLLKNHLLIHVDCTNMKYAFRKELFMASRDRLKSGKETNALRKYLADKLGALKSHLRIIEKSRKDSIVASSGNTKDLLKNFTKNLTINKELRALLGSTFKLDDTPKKPSKSKRPNNQKQNKKPFNPQRYPSYLKLNIKNKEGEIPVAKIPLGGSKTLKFETDVENTYFDRADDAGELQIALLNHKPNESTGGNSSGKPSGIEELMNVQKSSPKDGIIRVVFEPKNTVNVGDSLQVKVSLTDKGQTHDEIFFVKVSDPQQPKEKVPEKEEIDAPVGLPELVLVYQNSDDADAMTWDKLDSQGLEMKHSNVVVPFVEGNDNLELIYINMDSSVLKRMKSKHKNISEEQKSLAENKYISSVYFHTLFLYTITKQRNYSLYKVSEGSEGDVDIDISEYLRDLFDSHYSEFILNFGTVDLMESIG